MSLLPNSLRNKVGLVYIIGLALMLAVAVINWHYFNRLEEMIKSGEKASGFFETTLEIRRFEKNYFLYGKMVDYDSLMSFVNDADVMLQKSGEEDLAHYADSQTIARLKDDIVSYRSLLEKLPKNDGQLMDRRREELLREKGKAIVTAAEAMSKNEHAIMRSTLVSSRRSFVVAVLLIAIAWLAGGAILYRMFVRPLGRMERHMRKVAGGEISPMPVESRDREILSLNSAFNRMLLEIEWRQNHLVQSEKLASFGTLLFGVAHELNNPLSNIYTSCQILKEEIEEDGIEYKKELLTQIEEETDRAKEIVRSLLDYSRAGKKEVVSLRKLVEDSIRFIRGEAPAKVEIRLSVPEDINIFADRPRLQQVFLNLIKNGIDAMAGEGRITIEARRLPDGNVEVDITDTGTGIPPEHVDKIFDPFYTTKESKKGYGLGLFIVHSIIKEHEGTIDVDSKPGGGTSFIITLPSKEI
jgi:signal transduction histidine kinase